MLQKVISCKSARRDFAQQGHGQRDNACFAGSVSWPAHIERKFRSLRQSTLVLHRSQDQSATNGILGFQDFGIDCSCNARNETSVMAPDSSLHHISC